MPTPYTIKNVDQLDDSAPAFGLGEIQEAHFAGDAYEAEETGFAFFRLKPGKRQPFGHRHENAEEVYLVLAGSGRVKLDDEIRAVAHHDAIRVAPAVVRAFEAGPDGLELLAFGRHHEGDGEVIQGWWSEE